MAKSEKAQGKPKPGSKSTTIPTTKSSKVKRKSPPVAKQQLSNEFVQDSDDDLERPSATPVKLKEALVKKKTPEKPAPAKVPTAEVSSESESSSEESDASSSQASEKIEESAAKSASGSDSEDQEEDDSEDDENSDSSASSAPPTSKGKGPSSDSRQQQVSAPASHVSETRPAPPFQPPHGFKPANTPSTTSKTTELYQPQNTEGKQIWYITAPANVPISSLKELALDKLTEGEAVMSYKDIDYSFTTDETARLTTSLILPSENGFKPHPTEVQNVVHLRQIVKLPMAPQSEVRIPPPSLETSSQPIVQKRVKREQPKGLRMRFRPSGAGTGDIGTIGSSDTDEPASSKAAFSSVVSKKRKERDDDTVSGEKKRKKDKHPESNRNAVNTVTASKEASKKNIDSTSGLPTTGSGLKPNGVEDPKKKDKEKKKKKKRDGGKA